VPIDPTRLIINSPDAAGAEQDEAGVFSFPYAPVAGDEGAALVGAGEGEGYEDVFCVGESGELGVVFVGGVGGFVGVKGPFDRLRTCDVTAIAGGGSEGEAAGAEEGDQEGGAPAGAQDEEVVFLHCAVDWSMESWSLTLLVECYEGVDIMIYTSMSTFPTSRHRALHRSCVFISPSSP